MRNRYGLRALIVMALLALGCRMGVAQIGPRYVLELPAAGATTGAAGAGTGTVRLAAKGLALITFRGLRIITVAADAASFSAETVPDWPDADLLVVTPAAAGRYAGLAPLASLHKLPVIVTEPPAGTEGRPAVDAVAVAGSPRLYPMQTWDALHLRKGRTRLRVTALPGRPGTASVAGFMLEVGSGHSYYRVYVSGEAMEADEMAGLPRRLPGADLALLPGRDAPQLLVLQPARPGKGSGTAPGKPAALTDAGYAFASVKR